MVKWELSTLAYNVKYLIQFTIFYLQILCLKQTIITFISLKERNETCSWLGTLKPQILSYNGCGRGVVDLMGSNHPIKKYLEFLYTTILCIYEQTGWKNENANVTCWICTKNNFCMKIGWSIDNQSLVQVKYIKYIRKNKEYHVQLIELSSYKLPYLGWGGLGYPFLAHLKWRCNPSIFVFTFVPERWS